MERNIKQSILDIKRYYLIIFIISYFILPVIKLLDITWISNPVLYNQQVAVSALGLSAVGFIFVVLGMLTIKYSVLGVRTARSLNRYVIKNDKIVAIWLGTLALVAAFIVYITNLYSFEELIYNRTVAFRGMGILLFGYSTVVTYSSIFALYAYQAHKKVIILFIQFAILLIVSFGSRGLLLTFIISIFIFPARKINIDIVRRFSKYAIACIVGIGLLIGIVFVRQPGSVNTQVWLLQRSIVNSFSEGEMLVAVFDQYTDNYLWGQTIWDIRYIFYPRQIFDEKPLIWGKAIFEVDLGLKEPNTLFGTSYAFGQISELYANFGIIAVICGMYLWGLFFGFIDKIHRKCNYNSFGFFINILMLYIVLWIFRHGLLGFAQSILGFVLLLPIVFLICFRSIKSVAQTSSLQTY